MAISSSQLFGTILGMVVCAVITVVMSVIARQSRPGPLRPAHVAVTALPRIIAFTMFGYVVTADRRSFGDRLLAWKVSDGIGMVMMFATSLVVAWLILRNRLNAVSASVFE